MSSPVVVSYMIHTTLDYTPRVSSLEYTNAWLIFLVLVSCDKFWIKFIASLVSTFNFGFMTKKKLHPEMKLHQHSIYCANGKIQS